MIKHIALPLLQQKVIYYIASEFLSLAMDIMFNNQEGEPSQKYLPMQTKYIIPSDFHCFSGLASSMNRYTNFRVTKRQEIVTIRTVLIKSDFS